QRGSGLCRLVLGLVHDDEGRRGDGPCLLARLVGQDLVEALGPVGTGSSGLEGGVIRGHEGAACGLQLGVGQLVLLDVGVLDVADGVGQATHEGGHAFVALAACARGPVHGLAFANLFLPLGIDLGQVVGEAEGGARAVSAAHGSDGGVRQVHARVQGLDGLVIPLADLAQVDVAQHLAGQLELAGLDALDVDHGHDAADHGGKLHQTLLSQFFILERLVGGAEVHGLGFDLLDAGAGAHGLVVDLHAGGLVVVRSPLGVQRSREAGACASGFLLSQGLAHAARRQSTSHQNVNHRQLHVQTS
ncbi:hypothetical protein N9414_24358, partial [Nodularia spumigena CCY9414]